MEAHAEDWRRVAEEEETSEREGLSAAEVAARREQHGPNELPAARRPGVLRRLARQFHNPLIYLLLAAGATTLWIGHGLDAVVILGVVLINAAIGFLQEGRAERALEAVQGLLAPQAVVVRAGVRQAVEARELVPGDLVLLNPGDRVPADLRLVRADGLRAAEAVLTGESVPVDKSTGAVPAETPLAERTSMAYSGTTVAGGQGAGLVVATGAHTEIGRVGALVAGVESLRTPLTRRLDSFARRVSAVIVGVGLLAFLWGWWVSGMDLLEVFLAVVALAVAAIPEGMPAIVTITLAIGMRAMARQRALIRRLPAVETLGSVSVIGTDKTGTLTRNEMAVTRVLLPGGKQVHAGGVGYAPEGELSERAGGEPLSPETEDALRLLARCGLLCNEATLREEDGQWSAEGDPTEGALLALAGKAGLDRKKEEESFPRTGTLPFDAGRQLMATGHTDREGGNHLLCLKGAPERILERCAREAGGAALDADAWRERIEEIAGEGQRVLALAERQWATEDGPLDGEHLPADFVLLGMVGIVDPPREGVPEAVADCRRAGIRTLLITGDHATTAAAIGRQVGLSGGDVLTGHELATLDDEGLRERLPSLAVVARAAPEHKLRLVRALQAEGQLVAMTGDGVNDAPALKAADIGVAMGDRGTDAAREAAEMVLTDDNFTTIVGAVRQGRAVFDNIRKSLLFILPTSVGEAGLLLAAILLGTSLPVTAVQALWINLVTTVTLALALAFEPAEAGVLGRPPRDPREPLLHGPLLFHILTVSVLLMAACFGLFAWERAGGADLATARTAVVNLIAFTELLYLFNTRFLRRSSLHPRSFRGNSVVLYACLGLVGLQLLLTYAPPLQELFGTVALPARSWPPVLLFPVLLFLAVEAEKAWARQRAAARR
jgi:magnesium-transporting ATPase (P-type)